MQLKIKDEMDAALLLTGVNLLRHNNLQLASVLMGMPRVIVNDGS